MSIWASIIGRLKVKNLELARKIVEKSQPQPLREYSEVKIIPNQYFKGSEGGCLFWITDPDELAFEGNLRDCGVIEPIQSAFMDLVRDTKGQGFADIKINGDRWVIENYNDVLTIGFTFNPAKTFELKTGVGL